MVESVLPHVVARLPHFNLLVTGANPPDVVRGLAGPHVILAGHVADLTGFYATARLALAPLRYGSGVKIKTLEALLHGVPVLATTVGAEGCGLESFEALRPIDDAAAYAARLVCLMSERQPWEKARAAVESLIVVRRRTGGPTWTAVLMNAQLRRSGGRFALHA